MEKNGPALADEFLRGRFGSGSAVRYPAGSASDGLPARLYIPELGHGTWTGAARGNPV
jgi:hypothetical protein